MQVVSDWGEKLVIYSYKQNIYVSKLNYRGTDITFLSRKSKNKYYFAVHITL